MTTVDMTDKHKSEYVRVCVLKGQIKLSAVGMKPRAPVTKAKLMEMARELTGANFGPRDYDVAVHELEKRRDVLLTYIQNDG